VLNELTKKTTINSFANLRLCKEKQNFEINISFHFTRLMPTEAELLLACSMAHAIIEMAMPTFPK
jgi:hypothetical protein